MRWAFAGQLLTEMNCPRIMRVMLEKGRRITGACALLRWISIRSGMQRMDWAPVAFVGQTKHLVTGRSNKFHGMEKLLLKLNMELRDKGFKFTFTKLQPWDCHEKGNLAFSRYFYEYREAYGSLAPMKPKWFLYSWTKDAKIEIERWDQSLVHSWGYGPKIILCWWGRTY